MCEYCNRRPIDPEADLPAPSCWDCYVAFLLTPALLEPEEAL